MQHMLFKVDGMTCNGCVTSVQNALTSRVGVSKAVADLDNGSVSVEFDAGAVQPEELQKAIEDAGFEVVR